MEKNKKKPLKAFVSTFFSAFGTFLIIFIVYKLMATIFFPSPVSHTNYLSNTNPPANKRLFTVRVMKEVDRMNKLMPIKVDSFTEYTSVEFLPNNILKIYANLNVDTNLYDIRKVKALMDSELLKEVIMSEDLKVFRDYQVLVIYDFLDKNNRSLFTLNYSPEMYNK